MSAAAARNARLFPPLYHMARGLRSRARVRYPLVLILVGGCAAAQHATPDDAPPGVDAADTADAPSMTPDSRPVDARVTDAPADARAVDASPDATPDATPDA